MFGTRITTVFQSRWKAVTWSLGILATAYCSIPAADEAPPPAAKPAAEHHSPWDKDR
ncbi:hypothetical protein [Novosphingobium ginsenosidimutans]|uniref:hypothetical protein n=1 Tax=Novosphingobium ginsenosidimutans TaxID=1176536 RepID=UPI00137592B1|nr:hypothetical protein [Novosphingobium ginsenosidimutans]